MDIRPAEISAILKEQIKNFGQEAEVSEVGQVLSVGDGIARVYGLDNVTVEQVIFLVLELAQVLLAEGMCTEGGALFAEEALADARALGGRNRDAQPVAPAALPQRARRELHERRVVLDRVAESRRIAVRPAHGQRTAELADRAWCALQLGDPGGDDVADVESRERSAVPAACEAAGQGGRDDRAHSQRVGGRHEVQRRPHHGRTHRASVLDQVRELLRPEPVQPGPQPHVWRQRDLGLHPDEVLDHLERRTLAPT